MLTTVNLDDNPALKAHEIRHVGANRHLASKLEVCKTSIAQCEPELTLRIRHARTQSPSKRHRLRWDHVPCRRLVTLSPCGRGWTRAGRPAQAPADGERPGEGFVATAPSPASRPPSRLSLLGSLPLGTLSRKGRGFRSALLVHRAISHVVPSLASLSMMPFATKSSRIRSDSTKFFALRAASRSSIRRFSCSIPII